MHTSSVLALLLAAIGGTSAQHVHYTPAAVQKHVHSMLGKFHKYTDYAGPPATYWKAPSPSPTMPVQPPPSSVCDYWMADIKHQGVAAFNANPSTYQVFRNVKDFGAKGDGVTDDTAAINSAISSGGRCGPGTCQSTTTTPAVVYFPPGTYMINGSIIDYYYTQMIGNPNCLPTIKAFATFSGGLGLIDGDQYQNTGALGFGATNIFWRQIRNFIIDMTSIPAGGAVSGIHWPTAQATSIQNVIFQMSDAPGTQHQGIFIESGSGGFMNDLIFNGGLNGAAFGNQQFTVRNLTFNNAVTAIRQIWDWGWTYKNINVNNCSVALDMSSGGSSNQGVGSVVFIDSTITNTPVGIKTAYGPNAMPPAAGSLIVENVALNNVPVAIQDSTGTALQGTTGSTVIAAWGEGHSYTPNGPQTFQGTIPPVNRPASLVQSDGKYYERSKPQYRHVPLSGFISARDYGATGDGHTDDTAALQKAITAAQANGKILFIDHGDYLVTKTIYVPGGSRIVGESYSVILSSGTFFNNINKPQPVIQIGLPGESGSVEMSNIIASTQGQQMGAILYEYNLNSPSGSPSGLWDVHTRVGGFAGSNLQVGQCPTTPGTTVTSANLNQNCIAAFMSFHATNGSAGLYMENDWFWVADHDVEDPNLQQTTIYAGRGLLIESKAGTTWLVGTAVEHHTLYQYQFSGTQNSFAGQIQTETPYYQPNPSAPVPWPYNAAYNDPKFPQKTVTDGSLTIPASNSWGLRIDNSHALAFYGAGLYSFFNNYSTTCSNQGGSETCQDANLEVIGTSSGITVYNLNTVGVHWMLQLQGTNTALYSQNLDGFVDTIALFRTSS